ncbi:MAG: hypothetical protein QOG59_1353 [Solirubrobacteraceae bacterium]|jgi:Flp pilus assembly protein TadB|nr:hypothetical protein [Solirubrobacteraceae bacterium]
MRPYLILAVLIATAIPAIGLARPADAAATPSSFHSPRLVAFHFRGHRSIGGGGFLGGRRRSSHPVLRRVAHTLAFAYLLHLLFSHGGVSILLWLIVIALVVHLLRRRRRARYRY